MKRIKKKPNVARQSGYSGSSTGAALASFANQELKPPSDKLLKTDKLTEEQKIRLRAAGYLNI